MFLKALRSRVSKENGCSFRWRPSSFEEEIIKQSWAIFLLGLLWGILQTWRLDIEQKWNKKDFFGETLLLNREIWIYYFVVGVNNFQKSFTSWLSERPYIAEMVENGIRVWEEMTFFSLTMTLPAWCPPSIFYILLLFWINLLKCPILLRKLSKE